MVDQLIVGAIIVGALILFVWNYWRYDVVAMMALLAAALTGVVPADQVFSGFGNPAVITVAAVLVISYALWSAGVVDMLASLLGKAGNRPLLQLIALTGVTTFCSAFISNTGTMAIMIPVALQLTRKSGQSPSLMLMPMAFGSLLGGCITLIGTPPNIIIANYRRLAVGEPFGMFDFTPVGLTLAAAGLLFMWGLSRFLVPVRKGQGTREELYDIASYLTEVYVPEGSPFVEKTVRELEQALDADIFIVGMVRGERRLPAPAAQEVLRTNDVLIVETDAESMKALLDKTKLELNADEELAERFLTSDEISVLEGIVAPDSRLIGRTAAEMSLRRRYGANLLAVSRQGHRLKSRLSRIRLRAGDVLLLQGDTELLAGVFERLGCLPLAERSLRIGKPTRVLLAVGLFAAAIGTTVLGWTTVPVAFTACAGIMLFVGMVNLRELYDAIDWPIIVLLGATIPLGIALENTGTAQLVADTLLGLGADLPPAAAIAILLAGTMLLSNVVNNAAAAVLMAPIAISLARGLGVAVDPLLMAVAIGGALPFLTPIGHQSNVLVIGPGGYSFGDYWKLGLPLSLLTFVLAVPLILFAWPLAA